MENDIIIADTPELIDGFRLLAIKGKLFLESKGMKGRGPSALSIVKAEFNIKAKTAAIALPLYIQILKDKGILPQ